MLLVCRVGGGSYWRLVVKVVRHENRIIALGANIQSLSGLVTYYRHFCVRVFVVFACFFVGYSFFVAFSFVSSAGTG